MKNAGNLVNIEELRSAYKDCAPKLERKAPFEKYRHRSEDNIKKNLNEIVTYMRAWTGLIWIRIGIGAA
jgi:hypothetical protein